MPRNLIRGSWRADDAGPGVFVGPRHVVTLERTTISHQYRLVLINNAVLYTDASQLAQVWGGGPHPAPREAGDPPTSPVLKR